jgi:hypothetical protein
MYSANMLKNRWVRLPCRKPYVTTCQSSKSGAPLDGPELSGHKAKGRISRSPVNACSMKIATLASSSARVTGGRRCMVMPS